MFGISGVDKRDVLVGIRARDADLLRRLSGIHPIESTLSALLYVACAPVCPELAERHRSVLDQTPNRLIPHRPGAA